MTYASEVLADSPLWYARLGDASGTTMTDSSGNGRNGTYSNITLGTTGLLTGDSDTAASFNAVSSECNVPNGSWMNTSSVTYEALIKSSHLSAYHVFMCRDSAGTRGGMFRTTPSGKLEMEIRNNSGTLYTATGTTTLTTGTVYHVAAVFDSAGNTLKLYLNGVQDGSTVTTSGTAFSNSLPIELGVYAGAGLYWWNGVIDEAAYYGTALSSGRIAAHYTAATLVTASGTASLSLSASGGAAAPAAGSAALALSASGAVGQLASGTAALSLSASGAAKAPVAGSASLSLSASGSATLAAAGAAFLTLGSGGEAVPLYVTDTANAFRGLDLVGRADVLVEQAIATPPSPPSTVRVDKAIALPVPVLVKGRPT